MSQRALRGSRLPLAAVLTLLLLALGTAGASAATPDPWPMVAGSTTGVARAPVPLPRQAQVTRRFAYDTSLPSPQQTTAPVIGADGTIYQVNGQYLYAI